jgi:hypothetical protein
LPFTRTATPLASPTASLTPDQYHYGDHNPSCEQHGGTDQHDTSGDAHQHASADIHWYQHFDANHQRRWRRTGRVSTTVKHAVVVQPFGYPCFFGRGHTSAGGS